MSSTALQTDSRPLPAARPVCRRNRTPLCRLCLVQDPSTGLVAGLKLAELRTVPLSEAEHLAVLGDDPFGGLGGRGAIHKQLAIRGLSAYWAPGAAAAAAPAAAAVVVPAGVEAAAAAAAAAQAEGAAAPDALHPLLLPLDATLQVVAQMPGSQTDRSAADLYGEGGRAGEGLRVHAAAVVHSLQLSLHHDQAADMLRLADGLEWLAARSRCAAFRPPGAAAGAPPGIGARRQHWRRMWQHAANAVLADLRGQRDGVRWTDAGTRRRLRLGYIHLYSQHLEAFKPQRRSSGRAALQQAPAAAAAQQQQQQPGQEPGDADMRDASRESPSGSPGKPAAGDSALELELQGLERQLIVADIVLCRQAARLLAQAQEERASSSAPLTPTKRPRGPPDAAAQQDMPPRPSSPFLHQPTAPPSYGAGPALVAAGAADALSAAGARAGIERSRSGHSAAGSETDAARSQRGYISWGLSKLGSLLGYAPTAEVSDVPPACSLSRKCACCWHVSQHRACCAGAQCTHLFHPPSPDLFTQLAGSLAFVPCREALVSCWSPPSPMCASSTRRWTLTRSRRRA